MLTITPNVWKGEQWLTIEDSTDRVNLFHKILKYLSDTYNFPLPLADENSGTLTATFSIFNNTATLFLDDIALTLGIEPKGLRDAVMKDLQALPPDWLESNGK